MPLSTTETESFLLGGLPFGLLVGFALYLLTSWRKLIGFLVAGLLFTMYLALVFGFIASSGPLLVLGAVMLRFSLWVAVALLVVAAWMSTDHRSNLVIGAPSPLDGETASRLRALGYTVVGDAYGRWTATSQSGHTHHFASLDDLVFFSNTVSKQ